MFNSSNKSIAFLILGIVFLASNVCLGAEKKTILLLHSYNKELQWTDDLNNAIVQELKNDANITFEIRVEYMDTKRYEDSLYLQSFKKFFLSKYVNTCFDLIISTDNAAFDFLKENKVFFASDVPVVFCGLNNQIHFPENYTGILEDIDFESNLKLIQSLHPNSKIYIALDNSITGTALRNQLTPIIKTAFPNLNYEYLTDYSFAEFKAKLNSFTEGEVLFLVTFNYDKNGVSIPYDHILEEITPYCKVPIYGAWDFYLGAGIVGGRITSAYYHGLEAGKIAKKILNGSSLSDFKITSGPTKYIFDYRYIRKYDINEELIPDQAIIINKPENILQKNKTLFTLMLIVFIFLVTTIILLFSLFRRNKKALTLEKKYTAEIQNKQAKLKQALEKSREATSLQQAFLANLSHEIRTPMNGIMGFSDLLEELPSADTQVSKYVHFIKYNSRQLMNIIDDILEISLIETNKIVLDHKTININTLIDGVIKSSKVRNTESEAVKLFTNCSLSNEEAFINTDETKLTQILSNLLNNALKFTNEGYIELAYSVKGNDLEFMVKDTGIGIDKKNFENIFSRFGQVEKGTSRKFGGTGLGLSISKAYVELLGGKIWLESAPKKGSTFYFTIPAQFVKNEISKPSSPQKEYYWPDKTILVVDDEELNLLLFDAILTPTGLTLLKASSGLEAVEIFTENNKSIDLVLMDVKMPEMDGFEATEQIRAINKDIPTIFQTAHTVTFNKEKAQQFGVNKTIHKPIDRKELLKILKSFLG